MKYTQLFVIVGVVVPAVMAASLACKDPKHPCQTYNSFLDCSDDFVAALTQ